MDFDKINKVVDLALKMELHAFAMLGVGGILSCTGHKEEALLVIGSALTILKSGKGGQG